MINRVFLRLRLRIRWKPVEKSTDKTKMRNKQRWRSEHKCTQKKQNDISLSYIFLLHEPIDNYTCIRGICVLRRDIDQIHSFVCFMVLIQIIRSLDIA